MEAFALTGGMGSGKSTVAKRFIERGAHLIDADAIVANLQQPGEAVFEQMVKRWGSDIVASDGGLRRNKVAEIVFDNLAELRALNEIVHPPLYEEILACLEEFEDTDDVVVLDLPLLIDRDGNSIADRFGPLAGVIVVDVDERLAIERLIASRGLSEEDVRARIEVQASRKDRLTVADYVIDNSGDMAALIGRVDEVWEQMTALSKV